MDSISTGYRIGLMSDVGASRWKTAHNHTEEQGEAWADCYQSSRSLLQTNWVFKGILALRKIKHSSQDVTTRILSEYDHLIKKTPKYEISRGLITFESGLRMSQPDMIEREKKWYVLPKKERNIFPKLLTKVWSWIDVGCNEEIEKYRGRSWLGGSSRWLLELSQLFLKAVEIAQLQQSPSPDQGLEPLQHPLMADITP